MSDLKKIYELYIESKQNVCIDTRSKKIKNSIFFALKGTKYNEIHLHKKHLKELNTLLLMNLLKQMTNVLSKLKI